MRYAIVMISDIDDAFYEVLPAFEYQGEKCLLGHMIVWHGLVDL